MHLRKYQPFTPPDQYCCYDKGMKTFFSKYKSLVFIVSVCIGISSHASTYKSTDDHGNVSYSDTPSGNVEETKLPSSPTINLFPAPKQRSTAFEKTAPTDKATNHAYTTLEIMQPQDNSSLRNNAGNLPITLQIEPALLDGDTVSIKIDGVEVIKARKSTLSLNNINRGSHSLEASIINSHGKILKRSKTLTFHLHRQSVLINSSATNH